MSQAAAQTLWDSVGTLGERLAIMLCWLHHRRPSSGSWLKLGFEDGGLFESRIPLSTASFNSFWTGFRRRGTPPTHMETIKQCEEKT